MDRQKLWYMLGIAAVLLGLAVYFVMRSAHGETSAPSETCLVQETPEGETTPVDRNKTEGYLHADAARRSSAEEMWAGLEADMESPEDADTDSGGGMGGAVREYGRPEVKSPEELRGELLSEPETPSPQPEAVRGGRPVRSSGTMTQEERDDRVRHDYALVAEIVQKMYGGAEDSGTAPDSSSQSRNSNPPKETVPRSSGLLSSDSGWDEDGLSSIDSSAGDSSLDDGSRPCRCMFVRAEKVRSGQRVTLRLLEDMVVGGLVIPANSHMNAVCSLRDRLMVSVTGYEVNGRIYSLDLEGYDNDGSPGIYCPQVDGRSARTARNDALDIGESLSRTRVGSVASSVIRTGVNIVKGTAASSEACVSVPAGYTFYIMQRRKR